MRTHMVRTGVMLVLILAASTTFAFAGTDDGSKPDSHGWQYDHKGGQDNHDGGESDHNGRQPDQGGGSNHDGSSDHNGGCPSPSKVPLTEGLPFLAIAGTAYGVYALKKKRNMSDGN